MILPLHTQPINDEILSSWLVRLALHNGLPVHTFFNNLLGFKGQIWTRDIDRHPPIELFATLQKATGLDAFQIMAMTLQSYEGRLYESVSTYGDTPWIIAAGIYHRLRIRPGMQFCSVCLAEDVFPYYRKHWRVALSTHCAVHRYPLSDRCAKCHSPVIFHQHGVGKAKNINCDAGRFCFSCGFNLAEAPSQLDSSDQRLVANNLDLLAALTTGTSRFLSLSNENQLLFFKGVRALVGAISGRHGSKLRTELSATLGLVLRVEEGKDFEYQGADYRSDAMLSVAWILDAWPQRFIDLCHRANFTRSRFSESMSHVPNWVATIVDENLNCSLYTYSNAEIEAAVHYLLKKESEVSWQSLSDLLGIGRDAAKIALKRWHSSTRPEA